MSEVSACPSCGGTLSADQMAGINVFNCPFCGQIVHPANCICGDHGDSSDLAEIKKEALLGISLLGQMKKMKLENEAERARLGLPKEGADQTNRIFQGTTIVIGGGTVQKICIKCGTGNRQEANFCKHCGNRF